MRASDAEAVLRVLSEVNALDDVQRIVDKVCECVVDIGAYRVALLSLYFGEDVYIGLKGAEERLRRDFLANARHASEEQRAQKRHVIWRHHRLPGTSICFIPQGSPIPFGTSFRRSPECPGAEWQPEDRLMLFVRGADGEVRGVLSLDQPRDGKRPDPADLGSLLTVDRLIDLVGVVIHNKHLAAKLRESEERYAAVVEQGHDGILIEREGKILFANRRAARMAGTDPSRLVGRPRDSVVEEIGLVSIPGEKEGRLLRDDGQPPMDVAIRESPIRFGGSTANLLAVADITERKRVLQQLVRTMKMDSVGTLASGIAHDFNNLLGGILGYTSLLRMRLSPDDNLKRYVEAIERAADRAAGVTRQLLGIVRDEQVRVAAFAVGPLLEDITRLFEETLDPSIRLVVESGDEVPQILGDETQIHQVLLNVCLNARDAMPDGGVLTLGAARVERKNGLYVRLTVRDTGVGMDEETQARIFDPFFTTKKAGQGTGLGLYMAYRVIERHGGQVDVVSSPGQGTTVTIVLPASGTRATAEPASGASDAASQGGTVLLVDDEDLMREVGAEMLARLHYNVLTASDGREAVGLVERLGKEIRCVILDIAMPVMNGWEAARAIRRIDPDMPIVVSSGHDLSAAKGDSQGVDGALYLKKPYRLADLEALLKGISAPAVP